MSPDKFENIVSEVTDGLPDWVREAFDNIDLLVMDEPDDVLDSDGDGLLGLYIGTPLPERGSDYAGELPDIIYIFRNPHLDLGLDPASLREEIAKTIIHEIAHYFGIDDDHLDEIGWG